jgi:hypothetical protein
LHIQLLICAGARRNWHAALASRLQRRGHAVDFAYASGAPTPAGLQLLMRLEQTVYGLPAEHPTALAPVSPQDQAPGTQDLTIDLTGEQPRPVSIPTLKPFYDSQAPESFAADALLERRAPQVELLYTNPGAPPQCVARATPALEKPDLFTAGFDAVAACVVSLLEAAVRGLATRRLVSLGERASTSNPRRVSPPEFVLTSLIHKIANRLTRLAVHREHFRIGWRRLAGGDAMADTLSWPAQDYAYLPDDGRRYFADPFIFAHERRNFIFCEEYPYATGKGVLTAFEILADGKVSAALPVMEQDWHLSYPQVFARDGEIWMIPETCAANRIELYRATRFPDDWTREAVLIDNVRASDATLVEHGGRLWLFATIAEDGLSSWDALHLYYSDSLLGPWTAHPANPVLIDAGAARPAGAMFMHNGALWRPAQDCSRGYGGGLALCSVDRLDVQEFRQTVRARLKPPPELRAHGAHTLNCAAGFEVIDVVGARWRR